MSDIHDLIVDELFQQKSLAALIYLMDCGRELEFTVAGAECFISRSNSARKVSLWVDKEEHAFDRIDLLISHAEIGGKPFWEVWKSASLTTLF